jgi:DNA-binding LytR/AlgR family response regulator
MKISCVAVDDEPLALELMEDYINRTPFLSLSATFANALDCITYLKNNTVDLLFLDIQLEDLNGIQLLKVLKDKPLVIFTTAYNEYAIDGYDLDIVDYLLKPISFERFVKATSKVYEKIHLTNPAQKAETLQHKKGQEFIFVKTEFRLQKVNLADIQYIEGMGDYLKIVTSNEKIMTLMSFKKIEDMLPETHFCRVHKSFIVSVEHIISIEKSHIRIGERNIPISETYKKRFFDLLEVGKLI